MRERKVTLTAPLHARPASILSGAAGSFDATLTLEAEGRSADVRSVLSIMALDLGAGVEVVLRATGPDADDALAHLTSLLIDVGDVDV